ncbi:MAG TPA: tRNA (adenosine(37)-N6)-threonylcarbamoyltransferase complex dimerization subunit type 1 TsaB [Verrucomicrobiae bacterium]|nr:tRNA (adenosine(37)-N6)-threonylcarbamoyltransferase complex dimerization subunit type 1 TsaB [Verrucomicrobiae bacterium]
MKILALEFSSAQRSVAIVQAAGAHDGWIEHEAVQSGPASTPLTLIDQALRHAALEREQIDRLAIGLGPGSYNGIRAAIALAQGWQLARGVKLAGLSSAECIAAQAQTDGLRGTVAVAIDAQRGEFYLAIYDLTSIGWRELEPLRLASPNGVSECCAKGQTIVGPELDRWFPQAKNVWPRAVTLAKMAMLHSEFIPGENLQPIYLRPTSFVKAPPPRALPQ